MLRKESCYLCVLDNLVHYLKYTAGVENVNSYLVSEKRL